MFYFFDSYFANQYFGICDDVHTNTTKHRKHCKFGRGQKAKCWQITLMFMAAVLIFLHSAGGHTEWWCCVTGEIGTLSKHLVESKFTLQLPERWYQRHGRRRNPRALIWSVRSMRRNTHDHRGRCDVTLVCTCSWSVFCMTSSFGKVKSVRNWMIVCLETTEYVKCCDWLLFCVSSRDQHFKDKELLVSSSHFSLFIVRRMRVQPQ